MTWFLQHLNPATIRSYTEPLHPHRRRDRTVCVLDSGSGTEDKAHLRKRSRVDPPLSGVLSFGFREACYLLTMLTFLSCFLSPHSVTALLSRALFTCHRPSPTPCYFLAMPTLGEACWSARRAWQGWCSHSAPPALASASSPLGQAHSLGSPDRPPSSLPGAEGRAGPYLGRRVMVELLRRREAQGGG